jgi:hypothetical protein
LPLAPGSIVSEFQPETKYEDVPGFTKPIPCVPKPLEKPIEPPAPEPSPVPEITAGSLLESYFGSIKTPIEYLCFLTGIHSSKKEVNDAFLSDEDYTKIEHSSDEDGRWSDSWNWDEGQALLYQQIEARLNALGTKPFTKGDMRLIVTRVWNSFKDFKGVYEKKIKDTGEHLKKEWTYEVRKAGGDESIIERSIEMHKEELFSRYQPFFESNEGDPFFDKTPLYREKVSKAPFLLNS